MDVLSGWGHQSEVVGDVYEKKIRIKKKEKNNISAYSACGTKISKTSRTKDIQINKQMNKEMKFLIKSDYWLLIINIDDCVIVKADTLFSNLF